MSIILNGDTGVTAPEFDSTSDFGFKNLLINAGFRINNGNAGTAYVSGAVLAAGAYGHEMWKAGASGGNYTFTQLNTNTQITIAASKSIIQVVENLNVHETAYVLSWEGTAQARVGVNSATPSGAYASSPILITGQTAGTTMSVEFNEGTLGKPQLEKGTIATSFENRNYGEEQSLTQRYYQKVPMIVEVGTLWQSVSLPVEMRTAPTVSGGGDGFTIPAPSAQTMNAYQNTRAYLVLLASARL
jgi:hypothetical protein